jgi:hypothetical protein
MFFQTPERKMWQKLRDDNHIPQGAAKVSLGDSMEAAHKALKSGDLDKAIAGLEKLKTACESYKKEIEKKYHAFVHTFTEKVTSKVDFDLEKLKEAKTAKTAYHQKYVHAVELWVKATQGGESLTQFAHALRDVRKQVEEEAILIAWDESYHERAQLAGDAATQIYTGTITTVNDRTKADMKVLLEKLKPA